MKPKTLEQRLEEQTDRLLDILAEWIEYRCDTLDEADVLCDTLAKRIDRGDLIELISDIRNETR